MTFQYDRIIMETSNTKKQILIDLDGVLNNYDGNFDPDFIPSLRKGALEFLKTLNSYYSLKLFTARPKKIVAKWLIKNKIFTLFSGITNKKEPAYLYIDDRAVRFNGNYNETLKQVENFLVWYKSQIS